MRLAYLTQTYPPMVSGAAQVVQRLARGLAARGHAVLVIASSDRGSAYRAIEAGVTVERLHAWPNPLRVRQRFMLAPGPAVRRLLAGFRPNVVHLEDPTGLGLAGLRAARALSCAAVITWHQLPAWVALNVPPLPGLRALAEAGLWRYFGWWCRQVPGLTPTPTVADLMARHTGCRPQPISNGVDLRRFAPEPHAPGERETLLARYGLAPDRPVVLYTGRMDPDKRLHVAAEAVALTMRAVPVQWLVVGDGTQRAAVEQHCRELGIRPHCHFTGYVSADGDLPGLYRLAAVLLTASLIETQGMTVLEAGASGVPTVAVMAGALPELIVGGETGFLAPPEAGAAGLSARLVQVLTEPGLRATLAEGAWRMAHRHSIEASFDAHEAVYRELVEKANPDPGYPTRQTAHEG